MAFRLGTKHFKEVLPPLAPQGLQGLHGLQPPFFAAQGLHGLQPPFFAAQGLHGLQPPFFAAHGLHGLQAASWIKRGLGFAVGNGVDCAVPTVAVWAGADVNIVPPTMIPAPIKAGITVVDKRVPLKDFTSCLLFPIVI
ncbi:MAG: hypothetical protein O2817_02735 [Proteobacteria bacterium]|nr:hypothetical protein [Pseudomonadota bacterium]